MKLVFLGTGVPVPNPQRMSSSILIEVGASKILFDCGYGACRRLLEAGYRISDVDHLFFTHHHSDHNMDFAYLAISSWRQGRWHELMVFGPRGTRAFCDALLKAAFAPDIRWRKTIWKKGVREDVLVRVQEIDEGEIVSGKDWKVTALGVPHPPVPCAFAYRIAAAGKSVVLSGDTIYHPPLARFARGADLLVHEVMTPEEDSRSHTGHTGPEDVGKIARDAGVPKVVLTHLRSSEDPERLRREVSTNYQGEILIAEDLLSLELT